VIDIHTHILPGIDDGVRTEDDAVEFARVAEEDGVRTIVATPHCRDGFYVNDRDDVLAMTATLQNRLEREGVGIELVPGAEVHLCPDLVERVVDGRAPTLGNNGKTLLLELSLTQYPVELENLVFQLKLAGILPIFAHPERIRYFEDDIARYEAVVRMGAYGQITTGSLLGTFGRKTQDFSRELVQKGLIHVVASDAHNVRGRPPILSEAVSELASLVGEDLAGKMADEVPRALLRGEDVEPPEPQPSRRRRSFLSRWLGR
jgi:protein-tyrosine phosphatase